MSMNDGGAALEIALTFATIFVVIVVALIFLPLAHAIGKMINKRDVKQGREKANAKSRAGIENE